MNTNSIKSFAKEARLLLLDGVLQRLKYWGFNEDGSNDQELQSTKGGYIFRGQIYTDTSVPVKWKALKARLKNKQAVLDVIEEASYTWFNRLMAIKILEENGYLPPTLALTEGVRTPMVVQNAKKGLYDLSSQGDKDLLLEYLQEDKEEQAFGLLIADLCNRNKLLHDIFGRIDDYTEILLPQNLLQKDGVLDLINSDAISSTDYQEVELIGWLYQFYISDKKDEVFAGFKKNKKARAEDIPAATQIFTPKWIVKYMVENTVGKIYLDYEPTSSLKEVMKYLVQNDSDKDNKAIISDITELTLIDPASGSGHILVTGFELLFKMYREEGYTAKQAVDNILENNLFGLDIDDRAMQLARFAVLLKAAQFDADVLNRGIIPHVYSFPEASHFTSEELQNFLGHDGHQYTAELKVVLQLLNQGKNIGSALKLELSEEAQQHIKQRYADWLEKSKRAGLDIEQSSVWNRLRPFLDVLLVISKKYASVVANPPYMGQKSMNGELKDYVNTHYPLTKSDLCTVFIEVLPHYTTEKGKYGFIVPPSWMFLSSFERLRENVLSSQTVDSLLHLSRGVFGADFGSMSTVITNASPIDESIGTYYRLVERTFQEFYQGHLEELFLIAKNDTSFKYDFKTYSKEDPNFKHSEKGLILSYPNIPQTNFSKIPGSPIAYWVSFNILKTFEMEKVGHYAKARQGIATGDNSKFVRYWFELDNNEINTNSETIEEFHNSGSRYAFFNKGGGFQKWHISNMEVIKFDKLNFQLLSNSGNKLPSKPFYFKPGISWSKVSARSASFRLMPKGCVFSDAGQTLFYVKSKILLSLLNSNFSGAILDLLNPTINYTTNDVNSIPFDQELETKSELFEIQNRLVRFAKEQYYVEEESYTFKQHPFIMGASSISDAANSFRDEIIAILNEALSNEDKLNEIINETYNVSSDIDSYAKASKLALYDNWISLNEVIEGGAKEVIFLLDLCAATERLVSFFIGVFLGRYRLDQPGLNIAHPNPTEEETATYQYNGHNIEIDEDGILPLMGEDCAFPDDALVRTKDMVHAIWGEDSLTENINFIHDALGMDLHKWLTEKFWGYHTSMYKKKPIYWLFSSNVKKPQNAAFKVLVYMHRMDKYTVQKIQRNYLHPHQEYIKREIEKLSDNEENLSRQELKRLEQLRNHELECRDYNEVLKELANQQIEFDLDDGVSVNYAKFEGAVAKI